MVDLSIKKLWIYMQINKYLIMSCSTVTPVQIIINKYTLSSNCFFKQTSRPIKLSRDKESLSCSIKT